MKSWVFVVLISSVALSVQAAEKPVLETPAEKIDWKICEKEAKDYGCNGTDEEIWSCLEKKDEYLGDSCQKEHRKGDKRYGVVVDPKKVIELQR
jgi:hypothetical protein